MNSLSHTNDRTIGENKEVIALVGGGGGGMVKGGYNP